MWLHHGRFGRWINWRAFDVEEAKEVLGNELWRRWSRAHSPTFPSLHLRHNLFSYPSGALPTPQLILQPFRCLTYVTTLCPTLQSLYLRHNSLSNLSVTSPTSQLIIQPFRCFTYVTTHSPNLPLLYLRHSSFSKPSVALLTSQLILEPFVVSLTSQALHLRHLASHPWYTVLKFIPAIVYATLSFCLVNAAK